MIDLIIFTNYNMNRRKRMKESVLEMFKIGTLSFSGDVLSINEQPNGNKSSYIKCKNCSEIIDLNPVHGKVDCLDGEFDWGITCPKCQAYQKFTCYNWRKVIMSQGEPYTKWMKSDEEINNLIEK